jgi:hypothetical protein
MRYVVLAWLLFLLVMVRCSGIADAVHPAYEYRSYRVKAELNKMGLAHKAPLLLKGKGI